MPRSDRLWTHGFRFSFTPLKGVLPTFPSRYWFTIGLPQYLAFRDGPRRFGQGFSCPDLLRYRIGTIRLPVRGYHPLRRGFPARFRFAHGTLYAALQPRTAHKPNGLGYFPLRSPLLRESIFLSSPPGTEMFQFPGYAPSIRRYAARAAWVDPFGYVRIEPRRRVPGHFRSLPRPSSPAEAKASSVRHDSLLVNTATTTPRRSRASRRRRGGFGLVKSQSLPFAGQKKNQKPPNTRQKRLISFLIYLLYLVVISQYCQRTAPSVPAGRAV